jgi:hypothetical protein
VNVTGAPTARFTVSVPNAPPPWPTTLIAIVAMPAAAMDDATTRGLLFLLSPKPWPKMATGQPPAGAVPFGRKRLKCTRFVPWGAGAPVLEPTAGMTSSGVS